MDNTSYKNSKYFDKNGNIKVGMTIMINSPNDIYINPHFKPNGEGVEVKEEFGGLVRAYPVEEERFMIGIKPGEYQSPWGDVQVAKEGAYLNINYGNGRVKETYVINPDKNGNPAGGFKRSGEESEK